MKRFSSYAQWPKDTCRFSNDISSDTHDTREQAQAVCNMLRREGFGGGGLVFPIKTWVEETQTETKPICQNCRFWNSYHGAYNNYECMNEKVTDSDISAGVTVGVPLFTGKDFGCIHFEKKD